MRKLVFLISGVLETLFSPFLAVPLVTGSLV